MKRGLIALVALALVACGTPGTPDDNAFEQSVYRHTNVSTGDSFKIGLDFGGLPTMARSFCDSKLIASDEELALSNNQNWPMSPADTDTFVNMAIQTYCPQKTG